MSIAQRKEMDRKANNESSKANQGLAWGKSLPVQSVQEMVRRDPSCVPERYMRDIVDTKQDAAISSLSPNIPVIDFSLLSNGNEGERRKLDIASKEWGFFQIINHGVAEDILRRIRSAVAGFFELPLEKKRNYSMASDDLQGYGQAYVVSEEQKLDWSDIMFLLTLPPEARNLNYWPIVVPDFKDAIETYSMEMKRLTIELLANFSLMMNMNRDGLLGLHGEIRQGMRMNYYPICSRPDKVLGISPHSDGSSITILLQDDDITGLQIKYKGEWFPVKPIPNALVVNIGDAIEAWSNGMYKSIEHRAVANKNKARMSLATFVMPGDNVEIGPLDQMVDDINRPRIYKTIKYIYFIRHILGRKMEEGKVHTHFLKLEQEGMMLV